MSSSHLSFACHQSIQKALISFAPTSFNSARSTSLSRLRSTDYINYARALFRAYIIAPAIFAPDDLSPPFSTPTLICIPSSHPPALALLYDGDPGLGSGTLMVAECESIAPMRKKMPRRRADPSEASNFGLFPGSFKKRGQERLVLIVLTLFQH